MRKTPWAPASAAWASCEKEQAQAQDARHGCMDDLRRQLWSKFEKERERCRRDPTGEDRRRASGVVLIDWAGSDVVMIPGLGQA